MKSSLLVLEKSHNLVFSCAMMTMQNKGAHKNRFGEKTANERRANKKANLFVFF
jgi:hypothetical protein